MTQIRETKNTQKIRKIQNIYYFLFTNENQKNSVTQKHKCKQMQKKKEKRMDSVKK